MTTPADFTPVSRQCPHCGLTLHPDHDDAVSIPGERGWVRHGDVCDGAPMCGCRCEGGCPERASGEGLTPDRCEDCAITCVADERHGAMVDEAVASGRER